MADAGTLDPADLSPTFINPNYATPEQIASLRMYADQLQKPQPVNNWAQGLSELTRALVGGWMGHQSDQREGQALDATAHQAVPAYAAVAGLTGSQPNSSQVSPSSATSMSSFSPTFFDSYARAVQKVENPTGDPNAVSSAGALGPYQFMPATWAKFGRGDPRDPQAAAAALTRLTQANYGDLEAGLGRAPTPGELYLAHQQGVTGALSLLRNPQARAGDVVGQAAVRQNGGDPNMPAGQFASMWMQKFQSGFQPGAQASAAPTAPFNSNVTYMPASDSETAARPAAGEPYSQKMIPVIDPTSGAPTSFVPTGARLPPSASAVGGFTTPAEFTANGVTYRAPAGPVGQQQSAAPVQASSAASASPISPPSPSANVAQSVAGMTPEQLSLIMNNPRTTPETKALVSALIMPKTIAGPFGSTYITTLAEQAAGKQPRPYMEPGEKGAIKVGNVDVPTITTGTPAAPVTRFLAPGMAPAGQQPSPAGTQTPGTSPGATNSGPLPQSIVDLSTQASRLAAQQKGFEDESGKTSDLLSKYKDAGVEARGQMNQIDALAELGSRVGYGITPVIQQELGKFGLQTKGLPDIEAYQSVVNNLIPNLRPPGSGTLKDSEIEAFKGAVGGLMTTQPGRQLIAQNLKLMAQYKAAISDIAGDTSLSQDARMAKIQSLQPPTLQLSVDDAPADAAPTAAAAPAQAQNGPGRLMQPLRQTAAQAAQKAAILAKARDAIAQRAPPEAVKARLRQNGIDPAEL